MILEITPPFTSAELAKEYKRLCKIHHPDLGGNTEDFKALTNAYEMLKPLATDDVVIVDNDAVVQLDPEDLRGNHVVVYYNDWEVWAPLIVDVPKQYFSEGFAVIFICHQFGLKSKKACNPGTKPFVTTITLHGERFSVDVRESE